MEPHLVTVVAIDDDKGSLDFMKAALKQHPVEILTQTDADTGLKMVLDRRPQIVLLDLMMPTMNGLEVLDRIVEAAPETEVILITGQYSAESAVEAIRRGASDYITKPVNVNLLRDRIGKLVAEAQQRQAELQLDTELLKVYKFEGLIGRSPLMLQVFARIRRIAPHYRTALVTGASGTGKELVAAALHRLSPVSNNRFAVCNCSAVVETLFESELFGHVRGAFTGAAQDKIGLFEYAHGGTVFLDEIGEISFEMQSKLLRVLENREVQRVGSPAVKKVDVRVIAATNRNLQELIAEKKFREDLYYRLSMVEIELPRLADRREDLPLLQRFFIEQFAEQYGKPVKGITPRAQIVLSRHPWPGNIRELKSVFGSACMMVEGELIDVRDLPERIRTRPAEAENEDASELLSLAEVERRHVLRVLEQVGGNKVQAAKILGINRATVYRIVNEPDPGEEAAAGA
ncbi:MAG TPA: sigma-54 dependent transcriptional regulator [Bryobacteraceae bacterium]|jgi:DNA-binding NtrC family response regulator|nr:sigma-54 dependent transcriptional regulator [Bryobacteraceae bacterium]